MAILASPEPATIPPIAWAGLALYLVGIFFEWVGDWELARFKANQGADKEAAEKVKALWEQKEKIARANLMNYGYLQPSSRYARGLHPDYQ